MLFGIELGILVIEPEFFVIELGLLGTGLELFEVGLGSLGVEPELLVIEPALLAVGLGFLG